MLNSKRIAWLNRQLPPGRNFWYRSQSDAARGAYKVARRFGPGYQVRHHIYPSLNLRHFHIKAPSGRFLNLRFLYIPNMSEFEVGSSLRSGGSYKVDFQRPMSFPEAIAAGRGKPGVYIVRLKGRIIYTGEALDLGTRLVKHQAELRRMAVNPSLYGVSIGFVQRRDNRNPNKADLRKIEQAVIRRLQRSGRKLTNIRSTNTMKVIGKKPLKIAYTGKTPRINGKRWQRTVIRRGRAYEHTFKDDG